MSEEFRMLLAVDLSLPSARALEESVKFGKRLDASIILVHAFQAPHTPRTLAASIQEGPYAPYLEAEQQMQMQEVLELTETWAKRLRSHDLHVDVVAREGRPADVIVDVANERDVDVVALGGQGMGRVKRFFMGSVTKAVAEHLTRPLLVIPIKD